jgi:hypothetical protein
VSPSSPYARRPQPRNPPIAVPPPDLPVHPILADMDQSAARPHEMSQQQLGALRAWFSDPNQGGLYAFAWTFFGFRDLIPDLHGELCRLLGKWGSSASWNRLMVQIPRGSYKTSLCTMANGLWQITRNPNNTILICNERLDNSKKWLRAIREIVTTNRLFHIIYADILPPGIGFSDDRTLPRNWKWTDEEIIFERDPGIPEASLTAAGVGTATTGGHWTHIIKDDLVSEDAKNSESVMERVREWFDASKPLEKPPYKGADLVVCTPWTYRDVYRHILENYDYKLYRRSVLEPDPKTGELRSLLPHKWTVKELLAEQSANPFRFSAQMMCKPRAGKEQSFDINWLRYCRFRDDRISIYTRNYSPTAAEFLYGRQRPDEVPPQDFPLDWCSVALLVDPAASEPQRATNHHARTGMVVVARDPWGRTYVLDAWAEREEPGIVVDKMLELCATYRIRAVGIEEVSFSLIYSHWLRQEAARRSMAISVFGLPPLNRHKDDRIERLQPGFRKGLYYVRDHDNLRPFIQEYRDYPYGLTRDLLDALAYDNDVLRLPPLRHEIEDRYVAELDTRDEVTGY